MPEDKTGKQATGGDAGAGEQTPGDVQNLKGEFNRKFDNINTKVDSVLQTTKDLITQLNQQEVSRRETQVQSTGGEKNLNDLLYDDPEEYTRQIEARTEKKIREQIEAKEKQINADSQIVNRLTSDYPELSNPDDQLTKRAAELLQQEKDQSNPKIWRTVVLEAAQELGVRPSRLRKDDSNFSMGSSGTTRRANSRSREPELEEETIKFGQLMGLDMEDPKVQERLKGHTKRNWSRYQ